MDLREDKNAIKRFLAIFSGSSSSLTLLSCLIADKLVSVSSRGNVYELRDVGYAGHSSSE